MGYALFVIGAAGCGKTTLCRMMHERYMERKRRTVLVNLDPAVSCEHPEFSIDIRDHITLEDIMEEADFGPNGGLLAGIEAISDHIDILEIPEEEDGFLIFDCPGQIELYIHSDGIKKIIEYVQRFHQVIIVYGMDGLFSLDIQRFVAGSLSSVIAMSKFECSHINVLTKCDLIPEEEMDNLFINLDTEEIYEKMKKKEDTENRFNRALATIIGDNGLLNYIPLNYKEEGRLDELLDYIDFCLNYSDGEDQKIQE
ncbi:GPN-loop GTPase [Nematocida sp. LUAm3]|nr:GPN-loop GTPase [Nematocida sp. LUAm3]KAI5175669.1 GPN-loop GTPase [Nematocida sp. LUAm2]KAI5178575.1 GPN-loop GTPase [Nematocida sp. LUAm1]